MTSTERSTVVGVFDNHAEADRAVADLRQAGFRNDQIGVASPHSTELSGAAEKAAKVVGGASVGVAAGAGVGGLVALGILAGIIPGIGPAIAGGTLAVVLANAAGGAAIAGLAGALVGLGIPEDDAKHYESEFKAGRTLVTVKEVGARYNDAWAIMYRNGGYNKETAKAIDKAEATRGRAHATAAR